MQADLYFTPQQTDELSLRDKTVVVIDVLRASTSITAALRNGAKEVIPVTTVERAVKISGHLFGDVILLGGERNGKMIQGFNLGNSPAEYSEEKVKGKSIIFSSTNGSQAIERARYAQTLFLCGFVNISAVADKLRVLNNDFTIVCSGSDGKFSIEDSVCAGMLLHKLREGNPGELTLSDAAQATILLYRAHSRNILKMIRSSEHGRYLTEIGFADDLRACADVDAIPILPQMVGSSIRLKQDTEKKEPAKATIPS
jgi:2-phosphosulfolactate phosphatase